jgi:hypothetical protein
MFLVLDHYAFVPFQRAVETFLKMVAKQGKMSSPRDNYGAGKSLRPTLCSKEQIAGTLDFILHNGEN